MSCKYISGRKSEFVAQTHNFFLDKLFMSHADPIKNRASNGAQTCLYCILNYWLIVNIFSISALLISMLIIYFEKSIVLFQT